MRRASEPAVAWRMVLAGLIWDRSYSAYYRTKQRDISNHFYLLTSRLYMKLAAVMLSVVMHMQIKRQFFVSARNEYSKQHICLL